MPKPYVVKETIPEPPIIARGLPESHDFVPDDPDYYVVTFVRGAFKRFTTRNIPTREEAEQQADTYDRDYGEFGRRAFIHAVKGTRSFLIVRERTKHAAV